MQLLLLVLFLVSLFNPTPDPYWQNLQRVNLEWETNAEGWETIFAIPEPGPVVTLEVTSTSVFRGMGSDVEQWRPLVAGQFPPEQLDNALCVIRSESGGNPDAKNPRSNARGLFQIMTSVWADEFGWSYSDFYVPELNVYAAARIWERSGWVPWSPRTRRLCGL